MILCRSLHVTETYAGCLQGVPEPGSIFDSAREFIEKNYGPLCPVLILDPPRRSEQGYTLLPNWQYIAQLDSEAMDKDRHGSYLVVVWYEKECHFNIADVSSKFNWKDHAEDFDY